jgi:esterase
MKLFFRKSGIGCPLIILHGLYGSGDNWFTIGRKLSKFFTVYLVDQRNHGSSPHHPELSYSVMTDDLEELFDAEKLDSACLMGHSMGGKVAMNFTLRHPEKVKKLVVIDIALRNYILHGAFAPQATMHQNIIHALSELKINHSHDRSEIDKELSNSIHEKSIRQFLLKNIKRNDRGEFYWGMNLMAIEDNLENLMDGIDQMQSRFLGPVLVIRGIKSGYISDSDKEQFSQFFPAAEFRDFPTGHWVHGEKPEEVMRLLLKFLPG